VREGEVVERSGFLLMLIVKLLLLPSLCVFMMFAALGVCAEPMRIDDPTPRRVVVEFEVSSSDHPDHLDGSYSPPHPAWLERDEHGNPVVRIGAEVLEKTVFRARRPLPGSFSDWLWVFDERTGDVLSASFTGTFQHRLSFGLAATEIEAHVRAQMTTTESGGFTAPVLHWGRRLRRFCDASEGGGCTIMKPTRYDAARGYVNAVGSLEIESSFTRFETYSALGEARFSEVEGYAPLERQAPQWVAAVDEGEGAPRLEVNASVRSGFSSIDSSAPPPSR
jgi:hypothetical protein